MSEIKLPKIHVNAEFQRLWWTNVRWGLIAGVVLVFALFAFAKEEYREWWSHFREIGSMTLVLSALAGYVLLERSLKQDVSANAFDQLRMSSLSAWQMAWSRILIAPLLAWVGFVLGWGAMLLSEKLADGTTWNDVMYLLALPFAAWGVACGVLANALPVRENKRRWNGSVVQLILLMIVGMVWLQYWSHVLRDIELNDVKDSLAHINSFRFHFVSTMEDHMPSSMILFALMASVFVWARMANVLHLKRVDKIYVKLAVCAPVLAWWSLGNVQIFAATATLIYGGLTLLSLATQGVELNRFRLPVWVWTAPLGLAAAIMLQTFEVVLIWGQIVGLAVLVGISTRLRLGVNSVTVALAAYLLGHALWEVLF